MESTFILNVNTMTIQPSEVTIVDDDTVRFKFVGTTPFYVGDLVEITGLEGDGWVDLNKIHMITSCILLTESNEITVSTAGLAAYAGAMPTLTIKPFVCRQKPAAISNIVVESPSVLQVTVDDATAFKNGDLLDFADVTGAVELNGLAATAPMIVMGLVGPNVLRVSGANNCFANLSAYTGGGQVLLPYGGLIHLDSVRYHLICRPGTAYLGVIADGGQIRIYIDNNATAKDYRLHFFADAIGTVVAAGNHIHSHTLSAVATRYVDITLGIAYPKQITYDGGSTYYNAGALALRLANTDQANGPLYEDLTGVFNYMATLADIYVDKYGRVDVGYVNGATPESKTDIANQVWNTAATATPNALPTTIGDKINLIWAALFGKVVREGKTLKYYDDDGNHVLTRTIESTKELAGTEVVNAAVAS